MGNSIKEQILTCMQVELYIAEVNQWLKEKIKDMWCRIVDER